MSPFTVHVLVINTTTTTTKAPQSLQPPPPTRSAEKKKKNAQNNSHAGAKDHFARTPVLDQLSKSFKQQMKAAYQKATLETANDLLTTVNELTSQYYGAGVAKKSKILS